MLADRIEGKWIDAFCEVFERCAVKPGDTAAILSETQSRALNVPGVPPDRGRGWRKLGDQVRHQTGSAQRRRCPT